MVSIGSFNIDIAGWLSNSWIWVFIVGFIGLGLVIAVVLILFYTTYKRQITIFEEINGNLMPVLKTRARIIKLRAGGEEVMKTLFGGYYVSAYSKRVGAHSYWYVKGTDGYLYNFTLDKYATPKFIEGDMRMFNIAIDRLSQQTYGKQGFLEKYAVHLLLFAFLVVLILGIWFIVSEIGNAVSPLAQSSEIALKLGEMNKDTLARMDSLLRVLGKIPADWNYTGGLVPIPLN